MYGVIIVTDDVVDKLEAHGRLVAGRVDWEAAQEIKQLRSIGDELAYHLAQMIDVKLVQDSTLFGSSTVSVPALKAIVAWKNMRNTSDEI